METAVNLTPPLQDGRVEQGAANTKPKHFINRDRLLTVAEIAEYIQVKPKTIYTWVSQGIIPCIRKDRRIVRFRLDKIDRWLTEFEQRGRRTRRIPAGNIPS